MIEEPKVETGHPYVPYRGLKPGEKSAVFLRLCRKLKVSSGTPTDESFVWTHTPSNDFLRTAKNHGVKIHSQKEGDGYRIWRIC